MVDEVQPRALEPKQEAFCQEYLKDLNGTQAAMRAGYTDKPATAKVQASRLLSNDNVVARIQALMDERLDRTRIDQDYVLTSLKVVAERCLQRAPVMVRRGREFVQMVDEEGRNVWRFDSMGANKSLELLGKHLKLFTEKHEHTGPDGKPIEFRTMTDDQLEAKIKTLQAKLGIGKEEG